MTHPDVDIYDAPREVARRADFHLHSACSDGLSTPAEVVEAGASAGLLGLALTDHDTVAGLVEAEAAAAALGVAFLPALELSTYGDGGSTHLLGYGIDPGHPGLAEFLAGAVENRAERAEEMVRRLNRLGVDVSIDEVLAHTSPNGLVARPHVARALVDGGWVKSFNEAFDRFIASNAPAYVPTRTVAPAAGIQLIHAAGGVAVLAHGGKTHDDTAIAKLVEAGLDGLETIHPDHGPREIRRLRRLAAELELLETGGSDWHGPREARRGRLGKQPVPYEWFERLREVVSVRHVENRAASIEIGDDSDGS